jgi:glycosyltransferase involved in cell wall biosynthesis
MQAKLNIGVLTGRLPYPHGMAAVQRIHLLARAMAEAGIAVNVWVDGLDHWSVVRNVVPAGTYAGVAFEYLLGKTAASSSKLGRIIDRLRLVCAAGRRIATAARKHRLDGLYFNTPMLKLDFERAIVRFHCQRAKVPVVMGLCELPWSANLSGPSVRKLVSPLYGADGLIYISRYLERWAQGEQEKTGKTVRSLYIPILVDVNEFRPAQLPSVGKKVLFAGSPAYDETLRFLVEAMRMVWARYPDCELVITGGATETTLGPLASILPQVGRW